MSIEGSSEVQRWNVRDVAMGRIIDLDLNHPPPNENMALPGSLGLQVQGIGHYQGQATAAADFVDDEVVIISPRKFAEVWYLSLILNLIWKMLKVDFNFLVSTRFRPRIIHDKILLGEAVES